MTSFPYQREVREDQICHLIDARIHAIKNDVRIGRATTIERVVTHLHIRATREVARATVRAAVVGHSRAVGVANAGAVELAIFREAEALAEQDVADMERSRSERACRALAAFDHLQYANRRKLESTMPRPFLITARTATICITFSALAVSSVGAALLTAELLGDQPFGLTVVAGVR